MSDYSIYPKAIDGYAQLPLLVDRVTPINAEGINRLRSAILNIESTLGENPQGNFDSLVDRVVDAEATILLNENGIRSAKVIANEAKTTANSAESTADSAVEAANAAIAEALSASADAQSAEDRANEAKAAANNAQTSADDAQTSADAAQGSANAAQSTADSASTAASNAQSTADSASTAASNAQSTADSASTAASNAQSTADSASTAASNAQSTADSATIAANNAQGTADNIQIELDNTQSGAGLSSDGAYLADAGATYISGATSLHSADVLLDAAIASVASSGGIANVVDDTSPTLGGDLVTGGKKIKFASGTVNLIDIDFDEPSDTFNSVCFSSVKSMHFFLDANGGDSGQYFGIFNNIDPHNVSSTINKDTAIAYVHESGDFVTTGDLVLSRSPDTMTIGAGALSADQVVDFPDKSGLIAVDDGNGLNTNSLHPVEEVASPGTHLEVRGGNTSSGADDGGNLVLSGGQHGPAGGAFGNIQIGPVNTSDIRLGDKAVSLTVESSAKFNYGIQNKMTQITGAGPGPAIGHDCNNGYFFFHKTIAGNFDANLTNLAVDPGHSTEVILMLEQGVVAHGLNALEIGGSPQSIKWEGGAPPGLTPNSFDKISLNIINIPSAGYIVMASHKNFS